MGKRFVIVLWLLSTVFFTKTTSGQEDSKEIFYYKKWEQNLGFYYTGSENREEFRTDSIREYEKLTRGTAQFKYTNRFWNFLDFKQEQFEFNVMLGPLWGSGNWIDSSFVENIEADHKIRGVRTEANISYSSRYYWDRKNYTIVDVSAWGRYDFYKQTSDGTRIDSNGVSFPYAISGNQKKLRYGFQAKAGWGIGRFNPMNNYMLADYVLDQYYKRRNFSEAEIIKIADEIGKIKAERNSRAGHNTAKEVELLQQFISKEMFLELPNDLENEWQFGEFLPRFNGNRVEAGPFFKYYNREPDFVFGGYVKYENSKYSNYKWNRNFSAELIYNRYKQQDWALAEFDLGWSYFPNLKSQWDFGARYVPGVILNEFEDIQPIRHNFIPYFAYYTQVNSKLRIKAATALRIAENEQFMLAGPEFSLAVYWSKY